MTSFEQDTHVFIVRIWREPREIEEAQAEWRGVVEHIPTGQRRYFKDMDEIKHVVQPYLLELSNP
jgi:hypothetical protein